MTPPPAFPFASVKLPPRSPPLPCSPALLPRLQLLVPSREGGILLLLLPRSLLPCLALPGEEASPAASTAATKPLRSDRLGSVRTRSARSAARAREGEPERHKRPVPGRLARQAATWVLEPVGPLRKLLRGAVALGPKPRPL